MSGNQGDRQRKVDALLGRALRDKTFRDRLVANPADVARESGLSADELELIAGGLAIGSSLGSPGRLMYCTEKTCNEKGGARVVVWSPDPAISPNVTVGEAGPAGRTAVSPTPTQAAGTKAAQ
jgi:hypothetical protein